MGDENHHKLFSITVIGDHTPLLDAVADNPQGIELSLKESAGVDSIIKSVNLDGKIFKLQFFDVSKQEQFKFIWCKLKPYASIVRNTCLCHATYR
ncbi:hypothetical protein RGQ29_015483 [Quercus rubra]|uniref:Uncharacterized protein n=1 Tax=Quercus rubra TaxID=3512 RepID=A0AAN7J4T4_QUERU|nr:hypothetical protein RGQ29_015483 [Quercus rubra]